jgi:outer membrane biosynthesis protein TonB
MRPKYGPSVLLWIGCVACTPSIKRAEQPTTASTACVIRKQPAPKPAPRAQHAATPEGGIDLPEDGKCEHAPTPELVQELSDRVVPAAHCYEEALSADPAATSRVVVALRIGDDGTVGSSTVLQSGTSNPLLRSCLLAIFAQPYEPPSDGVCVDVRLPIDVSFKPGGA